MNNLVKLKKVMFVGDIHLSDKQPKNRLDNYCEAIKEKLTECLTVAEVMEKLVRKEMGIAYPLNAPLEVNVGFGKTWDLAAH